MATLYQTAATTRRIIIFFLIGAIIILGVDILQRAPSTTPIASNTRFYMNADAAFGTITFPEIKSLNVSRQAATYSLEGVYNVLPDVAYVYQVEKPREKLLVFENAQKNIDLLGFEADKFLDNNDGSFTWTDSNNSRFVTFNKNLQSWNLSTKYDANVNAIRRKSLSRDLNYYQRQVGRFISSMDFANYGMDDATVDVKYAKLDNGIFTQKSVAAEADYVIINAYRNLRFADLKPKADQPSVSNQALVPKVVDAQVYGLDPRIGQLYMVASDNFSNYSSDVYELKFTNFEYSTKTSSYYIITADEAWNKIQSGQGSLVSILPQNYNYFANYPDNLSVKKFTADRSKTVVAYYEPSEWTGYVYPIYIFEGRAELSDGRLANFIYYIDAIKR